MLERKKFFFFSFRILVCVSLSLLFFLYVASEENAESEKRDWIAFLCKLNRSCSFSFNAVFLLLFFCFLSFSLTYYCRRCC